MSDFSKLNDAISERDAAQLRSLIVSNEFVVISIADEDEGEDVAALTAELGDYEVLVAFTSEENAGAFVREMDDLFEDEEGVDGVIVEGTALLEYLPDGFGLLLDPENEGASVIDPSLALDVVKAG